MGLTAARKAAAILDNTRHIIAVEAIGTAQGLDMRSPLEPARATSAAVRAIRTGSPYLAEDRPLSDDIQAVAELVATGRLAGAVEEVTGPLP
jgi:histidine ammonia-lyase